LETAIKTAAHLRQVSTIDPSLADQVGREMLDPKMMEDYLKMVAEGRH
jgi:hypothetical protein